VIGGSREPGVGGRSGLDTQQPTTGNRWLAAAFFTLALVVRLLNAPYVFDSAGKPRIAPVDELYHWKRITYSAMHFPHVLEFDRDRGVGGAFCPWPPLYDVAAGGVARLLGACHPEPGEAPPRLADVRSAQVAGRSAVKDPVATIQRRRGPSTVLSPSGAKPALSEVKGAAQDDRADRVLACIVWFPPILFALFTGIAVFILMRTCGQLVAILTGIALATSPFLVTPSWIGSIDHHFLEPILTFAILGAACLGIRARTERERISAGVLLGLAITAAMFVQTALLIAAALAFAVLFLWSDGVAAIRGFAIAAVAVTFYRLTRAPGFPDNQWFLGWTHASLFAAAAVACAIASHRSAGGPPAGSRAARSRFFALLAGALILLASPTVPASLITGAHFLGGDRWLNTIQEFQPLWRARGDDLLSDLAGLSGGAVLVWFLLARAVRTRDYPRIAVALFAIVYLGLTITSRRFWIVAIPLLALAAALYVPLIARKRLAILAVLVIALPPPLQLAGWLMTPIPPVPPNQQQWFGAIAFLRTLPPGRVLGPWSLGHAIDVEGRHAVVIDNFGTMPDAHAFERAEDALLSHHEATLARFCDDYGVRYLVLEQPTFGVASANAITGTQRTMESTWWWWVWNGKQPKQFRLLWSDSQLRIYER
jgi:asparagine N-glycosylation enzyme membrane subunit Stt3